MTIAEVKRLLAKVTDVADPAIKELADDPRKGVQLALKATQNRLKRQQKQLSEFHHRFKYESKFWQQGCQFIAGVDEVGRGPLAGPVVACAVIVPQDFDLVDVNDSKQVSKEMRQRLFPLIKKEAISIGIGVVDNHDIDRLNIYEATRVAMKKAVGELDPKPTEIIVDAMQIPVPIHQTRLIKGDAKSISVSAASIVAKVYRDHLMTQFSQKYPQYDFEHNAGYGTAKHLAALKKFGPTPIHRMSFAPVQKNSKK
ncbi:ribonuclease HII [Lentilactobacillus kisonensis]|uniref:Ribonuclease HII n=1 Tax=Lentilactobacillus kisonensis DSM 19906 = JCM 15041 TaxID=1423766 RepID=A0A0R1P0W4_9LACO|nr:ribonuclease HII [Lentilactobacillus kisonensis]KRL23386.1 ribonuclease HII [Lentilactobacillus kisonensis DSM 19906 = JCM 15041]